MNPRTAFAAVLSLLLASSSVVAQEDPISRLAKVAERYVDAYNGKDLDAIVSLYTAEAEMLDEVETAIASGRDEIRARFEASFAESPKRQIALEVFSVRQIAPNLVVEEGTARFSGEDGEEEEQAIGYTALLTKVADGDWLIASTRELPSEPAEAPDPLEGLRSLVGEWVMQADGLQMDLFVWESTRGAQLLGSATMTTPADGTLSTDLRIGYDPLAKQVRWWTFDEAGGFASGTWQPVEDHWLVRTNGVTADGEASSALQELSFEGEDAILWESTRRFLDGEPQPDLVLRLVRRPPDPSLFEEVLQPEVGNEPEATPGTEVSPQ